MAVAVKSMRPSSAAVRSQANESASSGYVTDRVLRVGLMLAVAAVSVQTVAHLTNALFFDYEKWHMDATADGNALSWASSAATFSVGLAALLLGLVSRRPNWWMIALAAVLVFLSVDDIAAIHEKVAFVVGDGLGLPRLLTRALWPLLYAPLFAFIVLAMWQLSVQAADRIRNAIRLGLGLLALAIAAEGVATLWWSEDESRFLIDDLEVAVEEGAELGGWILIATGLLALACKRLLRLGAEGDLSSQADRDGPAR